MDFLPLYFCFGQEVQRQEQKETGKVVKTLELVLRMVWAPPPPPGAAGPLLPVSAHVQPLRRQNRPEGKPVCPGSPRRKAHDCLSVCRVRPWGPGPREAEDTSACSLPCP